VRVQIIKVLLYDWNLMPDYIHLMFASFIAFVATFFLTFPTIKLAKRFKFVDFPNYRKIHTKVTPRLGGLAIFLGAFIGALFLNIKSDYLFGIGFGALIIVIIGLLDDRFNIRPFV